MPKLTVDYSQMNLYSNVCNRKAFWRYWMGLEPALKPGQQYKASAMDFGWCIHEGLDAAYDYWLLPEKARVSLFTNCFGMDYAWDRFIAVPTAVATMCFKHSWNGAKERGFTEESGAEILREYANRYWPESRNGVDIVASEVSGFVPIEVPGIGTVLLAARVDRICKDRGAIKPFETKTGAELDELFWVKHEQSYQTDGYMLVAESMYGPINEVIIDGIATNSTARKTLPFKRRGFRNTPQRRARYLRWFIETVQGVCECLDRIDPSNFEAATEEEIIKNIYMHYYGGRKPHQYFLENPESCVKFKRVCEYLNLCQYDAPVAMVQNDFTFTWWRPYMDRRYHVKEKVPR